MDIQTKFKPGDTAWLMYDNRVTQVGITQVCVQVEIADNDPDDTSKYVAAAPVITCSVMMRDSVGRMLHIPQPQDQLCASAQELCDKLHANYVPLDDMRYHGVGDIKI